MKKTMEGQKTHGGRRTEYPPGSDAPAGSSPVLSVDLAEDEEVRWHWTHYPDGRSAVTGYDILKKEAERAEIPFDFKKAVADWLRQSDH
jgi:hypothetical protein